jgi:hypothetical protein
MNDESLHLKLRLMHLHLIESGGHVDLLTLLRHFCAPPFLGYCHGKSLSEGYARNYDNDAR